MVTDVLIAGGGVAGCAAALAVARAGASPLVVEAHPSSTEDLGAFLVIGSTAVHVLGELDALDAVDRVATTLHTMTVESVDASTVFEERPLARPGAPRYRLVTRGRLCEALQGRVRDHGIEIVRGARLSGVHGEVGDVVAEDGSGRRYRADLVVAADGLRSTLRRAVWPDSAAPRYVGQLLFWGFSPRTDIGSQYHLHLASETRRAFGYSPVEAGTYWFARVTAPEMSRAELDAADLTGLLSDTFTGPPRELVGSATEMFATSSYDLPWVGQWSGQGVLLIGDAAHAASPATGQGASLAFEDGLVLGKAVRDRPTLPEAVRVFERVRRDRAQANVVASARMSMGPAALADAPQGRPMDPEQALAQVRWDAPLAS